MLELADEMKAIFVILALGQNIGKIIEIVSLNTFRML